MSTARTFQKDCLRLHSPCGAHARSVHEKSIHRSVPTDNGRGAHIQQTPDLLGSCVHPTHDARVEANGGNKTWALPIKKEDVQMGRESGNPGGLHATGSTKSIQPSQTREWFTLEEKFPLHQLTSMLIPYSICPLLPNFPFASTPTVFYPGLQAFLPDSEVGAALRQGLWRTASEDFSANAETSSTRENHALQVDGAVWGGGNAPRPTLDEMDKKSRQTQVAFLSERRGRRSLSDCWETVSHRGEGNTATNLFEHYDAMSLPLSQARRTGSQHQLQRQAEDACKLFRSTSDGWHSRARAFDATQPYNEAGTTYGISNGRESQGAALAHRPTHSFPDTSTGQAKKSAAETAARGGAAPQPEHSTASSGERSAAILSVDKRLLVLLLALPWAATVAFYAYVPRRVRRQLQWLFPNLLLLVIFIISLAVFLQCRISIVLDLMVLLFQLIFWTLLALLAPSSGGQSSSSGVPYVGKYEPTCGITGEKSTFTPKEPPDGGGHSIGAADAAASRTQLAVKQRATVDQQWQRSPTFPAACTAATDGEELQEAALFTTATRTVLLGRKLQDPYSSRLVGRGALGAASKRTGDDAWKGKVVEKRGAFVKSSSRDCWERQRQATPATAEKGKDPVSLQSLSTADFTLAGAEIGEPFSVDNVGSIVAVVQGRRKEEEVYEGVVKQHKTENTLVLAPHGFVNRQITYKDLPQEEKRSQQQERDSRKTTISWLRAPHDADFHSAGSRLSPTTASPRDVEDDRHSGLDSFASGGDQQTTATAAPDSSAALAENVEEDVYTLQYTGEKPNAAPTAAPGARWMRQPSLLLEDALRNAFVPFPSPRITAAAAAATVRAATAAAGKSVHAAGTSEQRQRQEKRSQSAARKAGNRIGGVGELKTTTERIGDVEETRTTGDRVRDVGKTMMKEDICLVSLSDSSALEKHTDLLPIGAGRGGAVGLGTGVLRQEMETTDKEAAAALLTDATGLTFVLEEKITAYTQDRFKGDEAALPSLPRRAGGDDLVPDAAERRNTARGSLLLPQKKTDEDATEEMREGGGGGVAAESSSLQQDTQPFFYYPLFLQQTTTSSHQGASVRDFVVPYAVTGKEARLLGNCAEEKEKEENRGGNQEIRSLFTQEPEECRMAADVDLEAASSSRLPTIAAAAAGGDSGEGDPPEQILDIEQGQTEKSSLGFWPVLTGEERGLFLHPLLLEDEQQQQQLPYAGSSAAAAAAAGMRGGGVTLTACSLSASEVAEATTGENRELAADDKECDLLLEETFDFDFSCDELLLGSAAQQEEPNLNAATQQQPEKEKLAGLALLQQGRSNCSCLPDQHLHQQQQQHLGDEGDKQEEKQRGAASPPATEAGKATFSVQHPESTAADTAATGAASAAPALVLRKEDAEGGPQYAFSPSGGVSAREKALLTLSSCSAACTYPQDPQQQQQLQGPQQLPGKHHHHSPPYVQQQQQLSLQLTQVEQETKMYVSSMPARIPDFRGDAWSDEYPSIRAPLQQASFQSGRRNQCISEPFPAAAAAATQVQATAAADELCCSAGVMKTAAPTPGGQGRAVRSIPFAAAAVAGRGPALRLAVIHNYAKAPNHMEETHALEGPTIPAAATMNNPFCAAQKSKPSATAAGPHLSAVAAAAPAAENVATSVREAQKENAVVLLGEGGVIYPGGRATYQLPLGGKKGATRLLPAAAAGQTFYAGKRQGVSQTAAAAAGGAVVLGGGGTAATQAARDCAERGGLRPSLRRAAQAGNRATAVIAAAAADIREGVIAAEKEETRFSCPPFEVQPKGGRKEQQQEQHRGREGRKAVGETAAADTACRGGIAAAARGSAAAAASHAEGEKGSSSRFRGEAAEGGRGERGGGANPATKAHHTEARIIMQHYMALVRDCYRRRDSYGALQVLELLQKERRVQPDTQLLNYILLVCVAADAKELTQRLFKLMEESGCADLVTYNTVLKSFVEEENLAAAETLLQRMQRNSSISPDGVTFNLMVNACIVCRQHEKAWEYIDKIRAAELTPDKFTISTVIKSLQPGQNRHHIARALKLMEGVDVCEDLLLLSTCLDACARLGEYGHLKHLLASFEKSQLRLNAHAYGTVIKAYGRLGDMTRVWELWQQQEEESVAPSSYTYGCMLDCLTTNNQVAAALEMFRNMIDAGVADAMHFSVLMKGLSKHRAEGARAAISAYHMLKTCQERCSSSSERRSQSRTSALAGGRSVAPADMAGGGEEGDEGEGDCFIRRTRRRVAGQALESSQAQENSSEEGAGGRGEAVGGGGGKRDGEREEDDDEAAAAATAVAIAADSRSSAAGPAAAAAGGAAGKESEGLFPLPPSRPRINCYLQALNTISYNALLHLCVSTGYLKEGLRFFQDMQRHPRAVPDLITYSSIIKGLCCSSVPHGVEVALQLFQDMQQRARIKADAIVYNTLIQGAATRKKVQLVEMLLQEMIDNGVCPSSYTLCQCIKLHGKCNNLPRVLELHRELPARFHFEVDEYVHTALIAACSQNKAPLLAARVALSACRAGQHLSTAVLRKVVIDLQQRRQLAEEEVGSDRPSACRAAAVQEVVKELQSLIQQRLLQEEEQKQQPLHHHRSQLQRKQQFFLLQQQQRRHYVLQQQQSGEEAAAAAAADAQTDRREGEGSYSSSSSSKSFRIGGVGEGGWSGGGFDGVGTSHQMQQQPYCPQAYYSRQPQRYDSNRQQNHHPYRPPLLQRKQQQRQQKQLRQQGVGNRTRRGYPGRSHRNGEIQEQLQQRGGRGGRGRGVGGEMSAAARAVAGAAGVTGAAGVAAGTVAFYAAELPAAAPRVYSGGSTATAAASALQADTQ